MKKERGITLVALVITVIITLILAGVGISLITGEAGLFSRANHAATMYNQKAQEEAERLNALLSGNYTIPTIVEDGTDDPNDTNDTNDTNLAIANGTFDTKDMVNSPDVSKLNTSNFKYVTWVDNSGNNSNTANANEIAGTNAVPTKWHDYETGQWANIKTVNGSYEAYWVWIPRFAYQVPATAGNGNEAEIKVKFINGNGTTLADGSGNAVYATSIATNGLTANLNANYKDGGSEAKWIVHPAFSFGDSITDYSANTQLSGIWVAKFCASSNTPTETYGGGDVTNLKVMSVPGVYSWRGITLKNIWANVQAMTNGGAVVAKNGITTSANTDTIPASFIDTHPAKIMEWSAVSILSQSGYGVYNTKSSTGYSSGTKKATTYEGTTGTGDLQIWNNSMQYYTGYAATGKDTANENKNNLYAYNTVNGIKASTTGTVYGVYDMAGCSWEYVMGIYNGMSSVNSNYRPSMIATYYRYYDNYATTSRTTSGKIGDLTYETANTDSGTDNWRSDYAYFINSSNPVFRYGGYYDYTANAGVFAFSNFSGSSNSSISFRPIMVSV